MLQTSIIVPCYNEGNRLQVDVYWVMAQKLPHVRFWFVDDGSTDDTLEVLKKLVGSITPVPGLIHISSNVGKAEAVRRGILASLRQDGFPRCGFWDADLATPLDEIIRMNNVMDENTKITMVSGCRVQRLGAFIVRNPWRHYSGRVFATVASIVLGIPVYDTQCGAKIFRSEIAAELFSAPFISKWSFDVELFARLGQSRSMECVLEMPLLEWIDYPGSKLSFVAALRSTFDLLRIYKKYRWHSD